MISINDAVSLILAICGGIITIGGAVSVLAAVATKLRTPEKKQDEKIEKHEESIRLLSCRMDKLESCDKETEKRLRQMEESISLMMKVNFALLGHAINGNDLEHLKAVQNEVQEYLSSTKTKEV